MVRVEKEQQKEGRGSTVEILPKLGFAIGDALADNIAKAEAACLFARHQPQIRPFRWRR